MGGQAGNDLALFVHPNGRVQEGHLSSLSDSCAASLGVLCLAPSHALLRSAEPLVVKVCAGGAGTARSGKEKRGGLPLLPQDCVLLRISAGAQEFAVRACVLAALLELNARLLTTPEALREGPSDFGFVAIIKPQPAALSALRTRSLDAAAYAAAQG